MPRTPASSMKTQTEPPPGKIRGIQTTQMKTRGVVSQPEDRHRTRAAKVPFLMAHDILEVTNVDEVAWEFAWNRQKWIVQPQGTDYIPFPAVTMKMGDPRSISGNATKWEDENGNKGIVFSREEEMSRLCAIYGIEFENHAEVVDWAPRLIVKTMQGEEIQFPAQNPDMLAFPVQHAPQPGYETSDTRRELDRMAADRESLESEVAQLRSMIEDKLGGAPAPEAEPDMAAAASGGGATPDAGPKTGF